MPVSPRLRRRIVPLIDKLVFASSAYTHLKSATNEMGGALIRFDKPPTSPSDEALLAALRCLLPMSGRWSRSGNELSLVRVGGVNDGGYVMADDFNVAAAVSIGIGPDVSWDQAIAARGIPVTMFDPTIRRPPSRVPSSKFFRLGLGPEGHRRMEPLGSLVSRIEVPESERLLLKIDIEGSEYEALGMVEQDVLLRFSQIVIELHDISYLRYAESSRMMLRMLQRLRTSHLPVHIHANNYGGVCRFDSYWFANAVESTFVKKDLLYNIRPVNRIYSELDRPCDPRVAEISLEGLLDLDSPNGV